jgi:hypothetical protein
MNKITTETLEAVQYALNIIRNTRLPGCPHGYRDSYELAAQIDRLLKQAKT